MLREIDNYDLSIFQKVIEEINESFIANKFVPFINIV